MTYPQEYSFHDINLAWRRASLRGIGGRSSASRGYQKKKDMQALVPRQAFVGNLMMLSHSQSRPGTPQANGQAQSRRTNRSTMSGTTAGELGEEIVRQAGPCRPVGGRGIR